MTAHLPNAWCDGGPSCPGNRNDARMPTKPLYLPFDQEDHLPEPPWQPDTPALKAWEAAHGHDVRLKCYPEYGCQVLEISEYWRGYTDALNGNVYRP